MKSAVIFNKYKKYVAPNYGRLPVAIIEGKGTKAVGHDGKLYLDMLSGLGVNILGHSPVAVAKAVSKQAEKLMHTSNLYYTEPQGQLAEQLVKISFPSQALFVNSGAEAVESALKLARKYQHDKKNGRTEIISMQNSFHGRTYGALSATGQSKYHKGFKPLLPAFKHLPFGDAKALKKAVGSKTAAVIIEPVQGEGGVNAAPDGFLTKARKICDKAGALLIFDEVQCGLGRTGKWFAWQHENVVPDIMTLSKGLGGGFPIGAMLAKPEVMASFGPGTHASTFGGGPLACVAALAVINEVKKKKLLQNVNKISKEAVKELNSMVAEFDNCLRVKGKGLMIGMEVESGGAEIVADCLAQGLIINCIQGTVIRMLPPLNVTSAEMRRALKILRKAICQRTS